MVALNGWPGYTTLRKRVVLGSLEPVKREYERLQKQPDYILEADGTYRRQALETIYPGCVNWVEIRPAEVLPSGELRIRYYLNYWDYHVHPVDSFTLRRTSKGWRVIRDDRGNHSV